MGQGGISKGFSKRLNPTAWVRALRCNTVYITRYRSMRVPVSICTSYFMADKKALVSRTRSVIRFSELESLSVDMIRWLVT
jgi:hypothetical protein